MKIPSLIKKFCDAVWEYDVNTNDIFLHYDDMMSEFCGKWLPYDEVDRMFQDRFVSPLDLKTWQRLLSSAALQQFMASDKDEAQYYIRFVEMDKGSAWHEVYLQRMAHGRMLMASRNVKDQKRNATIAAALMPEFDFVASIEVSTGRYVMYHSEAHESDLPISMVGDYQQVMEDFNRDYVLPEESEMVTEQMQLDCVLKTLETKNEHVVYVTVLEKGHYAYKKVRYSYMSEAKNKILLTRTDVGELVTERKLRQQVVEKYYQYLQNMPVAFCSGKVLLDDNGAPADFQFTYSNRAHELLSGVEVDELVGKKFYEFFDNANPRWLEYYYDTAYHGIHHVVREYSPEIDKHLLLYTFRLDYGHCECVLLDESEQYFLNQELERSRENLRRILAATASVVFQFNPDNGEMTLLENRKEITRQVVDLAFLETHLAEKALVDEQYWEDIKAAFLRMSKGEHTMELDIRGRSQADQDWKWYRLTMFDFRDGYTHERQIFGFLQNIDRERSRVEEYRKRAQIDSLTGVFNAGTGRRKVTKALEAYRPGVDAAYAMIVVDMDNFKHINDSQGHMMGDRVLTEFAQILCRTFRTGDLIYRLGGDEFVVFVERLFEPSKNIEVMIHRLQLQMEAARQTFPLIACSVGVFVSSQAHTFDECYEAADRALYETKKGNKGTYTILMDL